MLIPQVETNQQLGTVPTRPPDESSKNAPPGLGCRRRATPSLRQPTPGAFSS